jgi:branched-subunit amino acid transport protein
MALSYNARRRWSLVILLVGLPVYIIAAVTIMSSLDRPPIWVEFLVYVALGVIWALPFKFVFQGIGKPDPDKPESRD